MEITRRDFLKYCGVSAAALGLSATELVRLEEVLATPGTPSVIWIQGASCTGCSISFLNLVSSTWPKNAADLLTKPLPNQPKVGINLIYHPNLMATAGQGAAKVAEDAYDAATSTSPTPYILVVEGGVPTAFGGRTCWAWNYNGVDVTFQQAVTDLAAHAAQVVCVGTCASFGGIPAAGGNPYRVRSVQAVTNRSTINIAGCPAHPDWIVGTIAKLLLGSSLPLDSNGRPTFIYGDTLHSRCPRNVAPFTNCLYNQGCRGPGTHGNCSTNLWNNKINWCVGAEAACYGCTEPTFPGAVPFRTMVYNPHGSTNLNCSSCHDDGVSTGGGTNYLPNPHGQNYTANDCIGCHGNVPNYTPPGGTTTGSGTVIPIDD
jgi:hydrogenase small subunit